MSAPYRLAMNTVGAEEIAAAKAVLDSGMLTMGSRVAELEQGFARWVGAGHALFVNSGSSANLLMVNAMLRRSDRGAPWKPGDEVLVPALAWPTTVWPVLQLGLVPVLVDVDPDTLAIDLSSAEGALTSRTKGMLLIHVLGQAADVARCTAFCGRHGLALLEDCCETIGAYRGGRHVGTFGVMASFSSYFSHHLNTVEGGFVITDDAALHDDLVSLRSHGGARGRSDRARWEAASPSLDPRFLFVLDGFNVRPNEIQAAIGSVQISRLDAMLAAREDLARRVSGILAGSAPWLRLVGRERLRKPAPGPRARENSWMSLPMIVEDDAPVDRDRVKRHLEARGVETRPIIAGNLSRHPAAKRLNLRRAPSLAQCDRVLDRGLMIGCHPFADPDALATLTEALGALARL